MISNQPTLFDLEPQQSPQLSGWRPLIEAFAGAKRSNKYRWIYDGGSYDVRLSPFAGSGGEYRHLYHIKNAIVADADPSVRAIWEAWCNAFHCPIYEYLNRQKAKFMNDGADIAFADLKARFEYCCANYTGLNNDFFDFAAVSLTFRRLTHGSIVRCAKTTGKLNVSMSADKLSKYWQWNYKFPEQMDSLFIGKHWTEAIDHLSQSDFQNAIAVIDPPYWVPYEPGTKRRGGGAMTPAYPGHDPSSADLFATCVDTVYEALLTDKVSRCVVFNYYSDTMDGAIRSVANQFRLPCWASDLGPLQPVSQGKLVHKANDEWVWEIGGRRMFGDRPQYEQESLLGV